jgi:hypothetical protein
LHAANGATWLRKFPGLSVVADIVGCQFKPYSGFKGTLEFSESVTAIGSQMLHVAADLDRLLSDGVSQADALERMAGQTLEYNPELLSLLRSFDAVRCCTWWSVACTTPWESHSNLIQ